MTGVQLARRLRTLAPGMPILIVSGYAAFGDGDADQFPLLAKPFDRTGLARALSTLVPPDTVVPIRRVV